MTLPLAKMDSCWTQIGIQGDRSCPELTKVAHCHNCPVYASAARAFLDREAPPGYRAESSEILARVDEAPLSESWSATVFELEDQGFAIDTKSIAEVLEARPVHRVPHRTNRVFEGLVNVHGQLELCASLHGLLHIERGRRDSGERTTARMIFAHTSGQRWVFPVDAIQGVVRFSKSDLGEVPATSPRGAQALASGVLRWGQRSIGYLDAEKLLPQFEQSLR
jgi:chemotaxis-related protein WspD